MDDEPFVPTPADSRYTEIPKQRSPRVRRSKWVSGEQDLNWGRGTPLTRQQIEARKRRERQGEKVIRSGPGFRVVEI